MLHDKRIDFVLRKGSTCAIEFLIKSDRIAEHHQRFEAGGSYSSLNCDDYVVVDIVPWISPRRWFRKRSRGLEDASFDDRKGFVQTLFLNIDQVSRREKHAVFLVSDDLNLGFLYTWNSTKSEPVLRAKSPRPSEPVFEFFR